MSNVVLQGLGPDVSVINFDASLEENPRYEAEVTQYEVETGGDASDNVRPKTSTIQLRAILADYPVPGPTPPLPFQTSPPLAGADGRSEILLGRLTNWWLSAQLFSCTISGIDSWPQVVIQEIEPSRNAQNAGDALEVRITLKEIRFVTTRTAVYKGSRAHKSKGPAPTKPVTPNPATIPPITGIGALVGSAKDLIHRVVGSVWNIFGSESDVEQSAAGQQGAAGTGAAP